MAVSLSFNYVLIEKQLRAEKHSPTREAKSAYDFKLFSSWNVLKESRKSHILCLAFNVLHYETLISSTLILHLLQ